MSALLGAFRTRGSKLLEAEAVLEPGTQEVPRKPVSCPGPADMSDGIARWAMHSPVCSSPTEGLLWVSPALNLLTA